MNVKTNTRVGNGEPCRSIALQRCFQSACRSKIELPRLVLTPLGLSCLLLPTSAGAGRMEPLSHSLTGAQDHPAAVYEVLTDPIYQPATGSYLGFMENPTSPSQFRVWWYAVDDANSFINIKWLKYGPGTPQEGLQAKHTASCSFLPSAAAMVWQSPEPGLPEEPYLLVAGVNKRTGGVVVQRWLVEAEGAVFETVEQPGGSTQVPIEPSLSIGGREELWSVSEELGFGPIKIIIPSLAVETRNLYFVAGRTGNVYTYNESWDYPILSVDATGNSQVPLSSVHLGNLEMFNSSSYGRNTHTQLGHCYVLRYVGYLPYPTVVLIDGNQDGFIDSVDEPTAEEFELIYQPPGLWE